MVPAEPSSNPTTHLSFERLCFCLGFPCLFTFSSTNFLFYPNFFIHPGMYVTFQRLFSWLLCLTLTYADCRSISSRFLFSYSPLSNFQKCGVKKVNFWSPQIFPITPDLCFCQVWNSKFRAICSQNIEIITLTTYEKPKASLILIPLQMTSFLRPGNFQYFNFIPRILKFSTMYQGHVVFQSLCQAFESPFYSGDSRPSVLESFVVLLLLLLFFIISSSYFLYSPLEPCYQNTEVLD